jgi:hypothetical protein
MRAERIGNPAQRLAQIVGQHLPIGDIVGHLAQTVHIVRKRHQTRGQTRQRLIGAADQRRAQHFLKRADMRQARWAIARLEQHRLSVRFPVWIAFHDLAGLLERPCFGNLCGGKKCFVCHNATPFAQGARNGKQGMAHRETPGPREHASPLYIIAAHPAPSFTITVAQNRPTEVSEHGANTPECS